MKADWTRAPTSVAARPSTVTTSRPANAEAGVTQVSVVSPSTSTAQAPHCSRPQPNLAPLSLSSSRRT